MRDDDDAGPTGADEAPVVRGPQAGYARGRALGIGEAAPRLSWTTATAIPGWVQAAYEVELDGVPQGEVEDDESVYVPWPGPPLRSRERRRVRARVRGADGSASPWSEPLDVEAGLLDAGDWSASWITPVEDEEGRPQHFRHAFDVTREVERARLYVTSAGIHEVALNGRKVGTNVLAPGWTTYGARLRYDTHDVTDLLTDGANVLGAVVADGWWRGHLGWEMKRNVYGDRLGLLAQLEVTYTDGSTVTIGTGPGWRTSVGPRLAADLYNGESYDARLVLDGWAEAGFDDATWPAADLFDPNVGELVAPLAPPVRAVEELPVREVITTPSGRTVLDFGQNVVGWVRFTVEGDTGTTVTLRHAEVLEHGELGTRPLRKAEATDRYTLRGGDPETWEPAFTSHGFRYVEVDGWPGDVDAAAFTAVVVHTDLEPTGTFTCSHELLDQLHRNVTWSMRGNAVDVPTDCPQRDERLGWTGDLQVFAPTATFLFDVTGFLADWLEDLRAEENPDGSIPVVVPGAPLGSVPEGSAVATWGDVSTFLPWDLYQRYGDRGLLERHLPSMRKWADLLLAKAGDRLLWPDQFQFGDWLDPDAPADQPWKAKTSPKLVADAYLARSVQIVSDAARALGHHDVAEAYAERAAAVSEAFRHEYVTPSGLVASDSVTAYALAIVFGLYEDRDQRARAGRRIAELAEANGYRISTGFVGTPLVLPALSAVGDTTTAYRLLTETSCPSWLYPVTMGATTVWERWDSMLPDGTINPGEMTSFNHYALGGVADWMHQVIGGLAPARPGYRELRVAPVPGRRVTSAAATLRTPYGSAACAWALDDTRLTLDLEVPPNASATVVLPGRAGDPLTVAAGTHHWAYTVTEEVAAAWKELP